MGLCSKLVPSAGLPHPLLTAAGDLQKACDVRESVNLILREHIHLQAVEFWQDGPHLWRLTYIFSYKIYTHYHLK